MSMVMQIITECYKNIEKADTMIHILQEQDLSEKDSYIILEILSTNIKNLTGLILEIQNETTKQKDL